MYFIHSVDPIDIMHGDAGSKYFGICQSLTGSYLSFRKQHIKMLLFGTQIILAFAGHHRFLQISKP